MISLPDPGTLEASMKRMSPPTGVQARPVATPGTEVRCAVSFSNLLCPRIALKSSTVTETLAEAPSATRIATFLSTAPMLRSRLRTPASRV